MPGQRLVHSYDGSKTYCRSESTPCEPKESPKEAPPNIGNMGSGKPNFLEPLIEKHHKTVVPVLALTKLLIV